jgi:hypothetical protein
MDDSGGLFQTIRGAIDEFVAAHKVTYRAKVAER